MIPVALYLEQNMDACAGHRLAGGAAWVYSRRAPDKDTPNEDAAALLPYDEQAGVLVVADGMGGQRGGVRASGATVRALHGALADGARDLLALRSAILNGIEHANTAVIELGIGAGTTLAAVEVQGDTIRPYHVGDSMILVVGQRGKIKHQTVSHSPVGYAVEAGLLDEKEALHHEERHLISNLIGSPNMRIEIGPQLRLAPRDTVLLATDGLFDNLHLAEIVELIRKGASKLACDALAARAAERMGHGGDGPAPSKPDDLTFVLFRLETASRS